MNCLTNNRFLRQIVEVQIFSEFKKRRKSDVSKIEIYSITFQFFN